MLTVEFSGAFPRSVSRPLLVRLARKAFDAGGGKGSAAVTMVAVGDAKMKSLNRRYRGKNKVTDILSFGNDDRFASPPLRLSAPSPLGDIIICLPQVSRQAKKIGRAFRDEMALMVVHGILHLLGYDHESLADERRMFGLQHEILLRARII
jgi:probable rRNA maturation factor